MTLVLCTCGLWTFQGQGLNLILSSENTRSLTHLATGELQVFNPFYHHIILVLLFHMIGLL